MMLLGAVASAVACGPRGSSSGPTPIPEPIPETCAIRTPARVGQGELPSDAPGNAPPGDALPTFVWQRSTIVVQAEVPLAGVQQGIEAKVPRRVAEERDRDLGAAGHLEYTVDRGPFTVRGEGGALVVESVLQIRAQACAKGRCYAGCNPEARITARVPLRLSADYKLRTSEVRIDVVRGCEIKALGGFLTIDVTPMLRGALAAQSRTVQASIDRELPDLRPQAQRLWTELSKPKALPLGACVVLAPEEITQGPASTAPDLAKLRLGLLARPEVRMPCGDAMTAAMSPTSPPSPHPLPPLRDDAALPGAGDVHLAIVLPRETAARAVVRPDPIAMGRAKARVARATRYVAAPGMLVELAGEVCGDVKVSLGGVAWNDAQSLHLTGVALAAGEGERLASVELDGGGVVGALERAPIPLPIAVAALDGMLPEMAKGASDDRVTITATVESVRPEVAGLRGEDIVAVALLRGAVTIRAK